MTNRIRGAPGSWRRRPAEDRHVAVPLRGLYTLERYLATGGVRGLCRRRWPTPQAVHDEVKPPPCSAAAAPASPPASKWGLTPQGVWPRYLVVNGDESEPGTYKDRLLMELDPHQLIEGCLIACYAAGLSQCFLYIRGEMALAQERVATALNEAYAAGYIGKNILGTDFSRRHRPALGRRRLRRRRGDGADREPRGQPWDAAAEAAVLPGGDRPVRPADDRQQRRDAGQPAVAAAQRRRRVHRDRHRDVARHAHGRRVRSRQATRRVRDRQRHDDVPRPASTARSSAGASATTTSSRRSCPAAARRRGSCPTSSTYRSRASSSAPPARCSVRARSW